MICVRVGVFLAAGVGLSTSVSADVCGDYWEQDQGRWQNQRGMFWTHQAAVDFSVCCWISRFCFNFRPGCSQITWLHPLPLCASVACTREALECGKMVWTGTACPGRSMFGSGESSGCCVQEERVYSIFIWITSIESSFLLKGGEKSRWLCACRKVLLQLIVVFAKDCVHKGRRSNIFCGNACLFWVYVYFCLFGSPSKTWHTQGHVRQHLLGVCFNTALHNSNFSMVTCSLLSRLL